MRSLKALIIASAALLGTATAAAADVRIRNDPGGRIADYVQDVRTLRMTGERVVIDGACYSACTLYSTLPKSQVCATPRARLGFHAAWGYGKARNGARIEVPDPEATSWLMDMYDNDMQRWIRSRGGLTRKLLMLQGRSLYAMVPRC